MLFRSVSQSRYDAHGIWILVGRAPGLPDDWDLWNPWIEDDHAFKLLIEFRVSLEFYKGEVMSFIRDGFTCQTLVVFRVLFEDYESPEEAVRAAIVETVHKYVLLDREQ